MNLISHTFYNITPHFIITYVNSVKQILTCKTHTHILMTKTGISFSLAHKYILQLLHDAFVRSIYIAANHSIYSFTLTLKDQKLKKKKKNHFH